MAVTDDERIRRGLTFLSLADRRIIKAAVQIAKLLGPDDPPDVGDLLFWFRFRVDRTRYSGRMTEEQYDYLKGHQGSLLEFANAIADIILNLNDVVVETLKSLDKGLTAPRSGAAAASAGVESPLEYYGTPPLGCCRYDTNLQRPEVLQSTCEGPLAGTWTVGPCPPGKPPLQEEEEAKGRAR